MREDFIDMHDRITNNRIFIQDEWYLFPNSPLAMEFIEWYRKETGCIEISSGNTHFRVIAYPTSRIRDLKGSKKRHNKYTDQMDPEKLKSNFDVLQRIKDINAGYSRGGASAYTPDMTQKIEKSVFDDF